MELINPFFTLAKIESGDMNIELSRIDICEICRESILDFYEIPLKLETKEKGILIDATYGRKTRSVIMMDTGQVVLSPNVPVTIGGRLDTKSEEREKK